MAYNYGLRPGVTQKVSPSGSSAATATAFGSQTEYVRVAADADVHIVFGGSPTATTSDIFLPVDKPEIFKVSPGEKMAAIGTANAKFEFDITVTNPGDGYNTATVTFTGGGGSNLAADLTVDPNTTQITGATITNQGTGYTSIPTYQVSNPDDVWNFNHIRARERGANGTTAFSHPVGKYARLAWRG